MKQLECDHSPLIIILMMNDDELSNDDEPCFAWLNVAPVKTGSVSWY